MIGSFSLLSIVFSHFIQEPAEGLQVLAKTAVRSILRLTFMNPCIVIQL
jgi:hypothetical protein